MGLVKAAAIGAPTAFHASRTKVANDISNPIYNPIYRKRKEDELQAEHQAEIPIFEGEKYLDRSGAKEKAEYIIQNNEWLKSIDQQRSIYIFYTSRGL